MARSSEFEALESRRLFAISVVAAPNLTALGDLNGDHKTDEAVIHRDLAARNILAEIDVGRGNGMFVESATATVPNFSPTAVTIGDVNGDGSPDIVMVGSALPSSGMTPMAISPITASTNQVVVLLGNGKGGFIRSSTAAAASERTFAVSRLISTSSVAVGDFDGDGFTDVAVLGEVNTIALTSASMQPSSAIDVLWDVAKPALAPVNTSPVSTELLIVPPANPNVNVLFAGDLDGDGRDDLVAVQSRQTAVLPTPVATPITASLSLRTAVQLTPAPAPIVTSTTIPIRPDMVTVRFPSGRTPTVVIGTNPLDIALPVLAPVASFSQQQTIGLAALSANGPMDLVGVRGSSIVYSAYSADSESFGEVRTAQSVNPPSNLASDAVYLGDIDGDGLADLLAVGGNGVFLGRNIPSTSSGGTVLFSWSRVFLPPVVLVGF